LGEQKLVKTIQSNSKDNIMQYVFFKKSVHGIQWGVGQSPPKL